MKEDSCVMNKIKTNNLQYYTQMICCDYNVAAADHNPD